MATPTFVSGVTTVTFTAPNIYAFPWQEPADAPIQAIERTAGNTMYITDKADARKVFVLNFSFINQTLLDSLLSFWETTVTGAKTSFTFNDHDGNAFTVRWLNGWDFVEFQSGRFTGSIVLEETA